MASAVGPQWRAVVVALAGSGLRIGEMLGQDVADINFLRRDIAVERQRNQAGNLAPLKSKSSRRIVPVGQVVIDELAAHLATYPTDGPLFVDEFGEPLLYRRWRVIWDAAAAKVGIDFTSNDLRHFYASALIAGGASVKQVQERLGHASPVITLGDVSATCGRATTTAHAMSWTPLWSLLRTPCGLGGHRTPKRAGQRA